MPWSDLSPKAVDDTAVTDPQKAEVRRLQELLDGAQVGSYGDQPVTMNRREASLYIDQLRFKWEKKNAARR